MKRILAGLRAVFVLCLSAMSVTAHAAPVGMAVSVPGAPRVQSGGAWRPLGALGRVSPGDQIQCPNGSEAVIVMFASGARFKVLSGHTATVNGTGVVGAQNMGALGGPSARVARALANSPTGAVRARPAQTNQRLTPDFPGWLAADAKSFAFLVPAGATSQSFALFDRNDNVVWMARTTAKPTSGADNQLYQRLDFPADAQLIAPNQPYVWRTVSYGASGKPREARWGVMTFLNAEDIALLKAADADLRAQATAANGTESLFLLAELYRQKGVLSRTLEILDGLSIKNTPGAKDALLRAYKEISPYAQTLSPWAADLARMPANLDLLSGANATMAPPP